MLGALVEITIVAKENVCAAQDTNDSLLLHCSQFLLSDPAARVPTSEVFSRRA